MSRRKDIAEEKMLLSIVILLLYLSVFLVAAISLSKLYKLRQFLGYRALMIALFGHCLGAAAAIAVMAIEPFELKVLFSRLRFLGFSIISPSIVIFINSLYLQWKWLEDRRTIALLYLPVVVTWILTCTPSLRDLLVTDYSAIQVGAFKVLKFHTGPWFDVHFLTSFGYTLVMLVLGSIAFFKVKRTKRLQIAVFWISILLVSMLDIYCVASNNDWRWAMLPGAAYVIADVAILYAGLRHKLFEVVPYATEKIFQSLSEPILVVDGEGRLETANRAALELFGLDRNTLGQSPDLILSESLTEDGRLFLKNRHFDVVSESLDGDKARVTGKIIYLREITAWMELEKSLNSRLHLKSTMLSMISHDVVGNLHAQSMLMRNIHTPQDEATRELIEVLVNSHETMHQFLRNVLNWEKLNSQRFELTRTALDIRLFVAECCEVVELMARMRGIRILPTFDLALGPIVRVDAEVIGSVLRNLLANAIKASADGESIALKVQTDAKSIVFDVLDQGVGMSEENVQMLLGKSIPMLEPVKTGNGGFGLGISIAKYFTRLHSGEFWIESSLGKGSRIGFSVPIVD
ncbi:MAG: PAS domain-containing protein [Proteobacteria bacterium]|nr:MAG: PAS domain-containing protein [Pseudomonadota bacterium]